MRPRAVSGPPEDLARFYAAEYEGVRSTLVLLTGHRRRGEALAREVFVRTCQHWDVVRTTGAPRTWVHRQAIDLATSDAGDDRAECQEREHVDASEIDVFEIEPPPVDERLVSALGALAEDERSVVVLRWAADLPVDQVAEVLGIPESSVAARGGHGLATLRELGIAAPEEDATPTGPVDERSPWAPIDPDELRS